jgi:CheY-like chemotaxis protein
MTDSVLIAEDELHIRLLIEQTLEDLEDEGVEIHSVPDGEQALEAARSLRPGVILLDVMMPKRSGFEVCEQLKADPELKRIKIFLLTAKGQEYDRRKGEAAGADLYITKPFDPDALLEHVRAALGLD